MDTSDLIDVAPHDSSDDLYENLTLSPLNVHDKSFTIARNNTCTIGKTTMELLINVSIQEKLAVDRLTNEFRRGRHILTFFLIMTFLLGFIIVGLLSVTVYLLLELSVQI